MTTHFDESQAVKVLRAVGEVVQNLTLGGKIIIPDEEQFHRAVVHSRDRKDWDAYVSSLRDWLLCAYDVHNEYLSAQRTIERLSSDARSASNEQGGLL